MLDKRSLIRLGILLCCLQLLNTGFWLWHLQTFNAEKDRLLRQQFRDHSAQIADALQPVINSSHERINAVVDDQMALPELVSLAIYDNAEQPISIVGNPLPLHQGEHSSYHERQSGNMFVVEQPLTANAKPVAILQNRYSFEPATLLQLMLASWPALLAAVFSLVLFLWLFARSLRPANEQLDSLESHLAQLRNSKIPSTVEGIKGFERICEHINVLQRNWYQRVKTLQKQLAQQTVKHERLDRLLQGLNAVLWHSNPPSDRLEGISDNITELFNYPKEYWLGESFLRDHVHPTDFKYIREFLHHPSPNANADTFEIRIRDKNNNWRWLRCALLVQGQERDLYCSGAFLDITDAKLHEQRAIELSNSDPLTGLYNRQFFLHFLEDHIADQRRNNNIGALLFMDLDRFEFANAMFGQKVGDAFLARFAKHLGELFADAGTLGRVGGDEFAVILPGYNSDQAIRITQQLLEILHKTEFVQDNSSIPFSASIGIALFPEHGTDADRLLTLASSAMYQAKKRGRGTYQMAAAGETQSGQEDLGVIWDERLRKALEAENLALFFQPVIDLDIGMIHHYECLLRLFDDIGRCIEAHNFMAPAERLGLLDKLERWSLVNALRTQGVNASVGQHISLTINLSSRQINHSDLVQTILQTSEENDVTPDNILFEISVGTVANNIVRVRELINDLREYGFHFALDNFGIGTLSFEDLRSLEIDYLKIDGDLVSKVVWSPADRAMVQAISDLARGLDVKLIAMGVESDQVLKVLRRLNVGYGQGRLFAEPAPRFHEHERIILTDPDEEDWKK